ncbi:hypothetical protein AVEN_51946-1 [Araneus ventricosus]|uniref:Uncharacterized protein n=1 Tax=Araneus ventricosus TaxID=182803 RepID=A0A4Y2UFT8_ARAVE|nr:hypothetical protein AVEN_51946-1 [Araneus ventricosus]
MLRQRLFQWKQDLCRVVKFSEVLFVTTMETFDPFSGRDIFDSKYRFALDIVMEVRKWLLGLSRWKLPDIRYNLFTDEHKKAIKRYEFSQEENFISAIKKNTNGIFDNNTFTLCLERFKETYKPEQYSEIGFVCYCSQQ